MVINWPIYSTFFSCKTDPDCQKKHVYRHSYYYESSCLSELSIFGNDLFIYIYRGAYSQYLLKFGVYYYFETSCCFTMAGHSRFCLWKLRRKTKSDCRREYLYPRSPSLNLHTVSCDMYMHSLTSKHENGYFFIIPSISAHSHLQCT